MLLRFIWRSLFYSSLIFMLSIIFCLVSLVVLPIYFDVAKSFYNATYQHLALTRIDRLLLDSFLWILMLVVACQTTYTYWHHQQTKQILQPTTTRH